MRQIPWDRVRHLLAIAPDDDAPALAPALAALRATHPAIRTTLLTTRRGKRAAELLRWDGDVLECDQDVDPMSVGGDEAAWTARTRGLIDNLKGRDFDAAVVFTGPDQSPHVWGYVAYLAGIDHRCGLSDEFGGAVLSHEVRPPVPESGDRHLGLLEASGLLAIVPDQVPPARRIVEA